MKDIFKFSLGNYSDLPLHVRQIKYGIWAYLFMILMEGVLRKWFLPSLATPLLVVRDPIAIWVMVKAYQHHMFPSNKYLPWVFIISLISLLATMAVGHGNLGVALFGVRILIVHLPFMFVIGKVFDHDDVVNVGLWFLKLSIPMVILIGMQFYSPQTAWVNIGVGGEGGSGFSGSGEFMRPSGVFSFTIGNVQFFQVLTAYLFYFFLNNKSVNKFLLIGASIALVMAIPFSISRTLFFNLMVVGLFAVIASIKKRKYIMKLINLGGIGILVLIILSQTSVFKVSTSAFTDRFESANEQEGGAEGILVDRILGGLLGALEYAGQDKSILGKGLGMGTNVGAKLLTGNVSYLIAEGDWGRIVGEMGPILGLLIIFIRVHLGYKITIQSYSSLRNGDVLPFMLASFGVITIAQGLWAQPTCLGFSTLIGGLIIASFNTSDSSTNTIVE